MNPLRWVRWKVVGVLAAIGLTGYFLGIDSIALSRVNSAGEESDAARWSVQDVALGILAGRAELLDLLVDTPGGGGAPAEPSAVTEERVFNAAAVKFDLSMGELLARRYVVEQVMLDAPQLLMQRREDGTVNIGDLGGKPEDEPEEPPGESRDWVETVRTWYERIQKVREWRSKKGDEDVGDGEVEGSGAPWSVDYSRGVQYPYEGRPSFEVRQIVTQNLSIEFSDPTSTAKIPPITGGTLRVDHITSSPSVQKEPTAFELSGDMGESRISVQGTVDLRGGSSIFQLDATLSSLPVALIDAFVGPSLPVILKSGTLSIDSKIRLAGRDEMLVAPRLVFQDIILEPKDPNGKIAGFEAARFTKAFNEASRELGTLEISDLRITGSLAAPQFEWGDTVKNLVVSGATAFAKKQAEAGLERVKEGAGKHIDQVLSPEDASKIKESMKKADVKDIEQGLRGIFGGKTKKAENDEE